MIHQPLGGFQGQASDIEIHAKEILLFEGPSKWVVGSAYGKIDSEIEKDTDRDNFMNAEEAVKYGLVDEVLRARS